MEEVTWEVLEGDCLKYLKEDRIKDIDLTFLDPPYNQGKDYQYFDDDKDPEQYWSWIEKVLKETYEATTPGGAIYFMQREKNAEYVLRSLRNAGWTYQNLIVWRKKTSAVPSKYRFGKKYQIIAFATKGEKPRVFNHLRIDPPLPPNYKHERENGMRVTDTWADIRELTSGYFAGKEAFRDEEGNRIHKQQAPIELLVRIILSSTMPGDTVFDPMAGTGTALVTACQLSRDSIGIEIDPEYVKLTKERLKNIREADKVSKYYRDYILTPDLEKIWGGKNKPKQKTLERVRD